MNQGLLGGTGGRFVSPVIPLPATAVALAAAFNHGLHVTPIGAVWSLVCKQADQGYQPGDEVECASVSNGSNGGLVFYTNKNGTQVTLTYASTTLTAINRGGTALAALTASHWGVKCVAWI